jgi:hypothetical protein
MRGFHIVIREEPIILVSIVKTDILSKKASLDTQSDPPVMVGLLLVN